MSLSDLLQKIQNAPLLSTTAGGAQAVNLSTPSFAAAAQGVNANTASAITGQYNYASMPVWMNLNNFKDAYDNGTENVTDKDVNAAFDKIALYERSEAGKENALFWSEYYYGGITHNGKITNNGCVQRGVYNLINGGYGDITYIDDDGNLVTKDAATAMADSFDCAQDLYIEKMIPELIAEFGGNCAYTYGDSMGILAHKAEIEAKYGIRIEEIYDESGQHRTYSFSLVDTEGKVIENTDGSKASIIWGDWVIPDGTAQGSENNLSSILDQLGYDCVSRADFMDNEALGGAEGFNEMMKAVEADVQAIRSGKEAKYSKVGTMDAKDLYLSAKCEYYSKGNNVSGNFGTSNPDLQGGVSGDIGSFDTNKDGKIDENEMKKYEESIKDEKTKDKKVKEETKSKGKDKEVQQETDITEITSQNINELEDIIAQAQEENPDVDVDEIIEEFAKDNNLDEKELAKML